MLLVNPLSFLNAFVAVFIPELIPYLSAGGGGLSIADILKDASSVFQWFITSMTSLVSFIATNPPILIMFMVMLSGAAIGMFVRVWHSV